MQASDVDCPTPKRYFLLPTKIADLRTLQLGVEKTVVLHRSLPKSKASRWDLASEHELLILQHSACCLRDVAFLL